VMWTLGGLKALAPSTLPRLAQVAVDLRVWGFALAISLAVSILVGLPAAARASRVDLTRLLKGSGRRTTGGRGSRRRRESLVTFQLAMALVLVTGAILTARSVLAVAALDLGYRTDNVAVVTTQIWRQYPTGPGQTAFVRESLERLRATPGVRDVGITSGLPLARQAFADEATFFVEADGTPVEGRASSASAATVTPGYFDALGIRLLAGRPFGPGDAADAAPVVIVNEELARRHFPGGSPVGERLTVTFAGPPRSMEVIGLVGDVRFAALDQDPGPRLYIHHPQAPNGALHFVAGTSVDPSTLVESIKQELWEVNSALSIGDSYAFRELRADAERERRFYALLLVAFAVTALAIAAVGLYGLGAYTVARQRSEIGIMLALGATPRRVARLFVARGGRLLGIGLALGLAAALGLTRFLRGLLFGLSPTDPLTLALSIVGLGGIGLLAMWMPARRASRLDPTEALRTD
jgi:putative ABC transport system permease protein